MRKLNLLKSAGAAALLASLALPPAWADVDTPGRLAGELPACANGSTGLVLSVLPESHSARVQRGDLTARLHDLAQLCPDDTIILGAGEVALVEIEDDRTSADPLEGPIEYQVPAGRSMLGNATEVFARIIFPSVSDRMRTLVTRSEGTRISPRPENMGARLPQELAYTSEPRAMWFGWTDGVAPFHVTLEDASGEVLAEATISQAEAAAIRDSRRRANGAVVDVPFDVTLAPVALEPGSYRFRVADRNSEPPEIAELMSDADAGIMNLPFRVRDDLAPIPSRASVASASADSDLRATVEALCFSLEQPENRLLEAAQHIVDGRQGAPYAMSISLLGAELSDADRAALCG